ncbi:MAG TPA: NADH-quinone oxidoreductase subunit M [Bdellovibrionota bacterium]|nr:NADH-quinone oxidoreductase subunit M [Bdellovibrionota bacterium]
MNNHLISSMVLLPLVGALFQAFLPGIRGIRSDMVARWMALSASLAASICGFVLVISMQRGTADLQAIEILEWVGSYAISYDMGVDGLNALIVLLVSIIFPVLIASEWNQKVGARGMYGLFLILQTAFFGVACAQDLFLLFFFWALSALPFYFLIGIWGGPGREGAAFRSVVAASIGNALLFAALILVYYSVDPHSFSLRELANAKLTGKNFEILGHEFSLSVVAFSLIAIGLAFRAAIWPLHSWFTHAAREAPPSVFVALSAVTVPVAIYIFMRLSYTLFPESLLAAGNIIVAVGAINLFVGGVSSVAQRDLRLLLAFLCVGEVGFVLLGVGSLNSAGVVGAVYEQLVLGLGLAGFGLFSGLLNDRAGHSVFMREDGGPRPLGGIATRAPTMAVISGIFVASLLGFPGLGGFVGHSLLLIGGYPGHPLAVILALCAVLLATYYLFVMYRLIFLGDSSVEMGVFGDLTLREQAYLLPLVSGLLFCGMYPKPLLELVRPTVLTLLSTVK